MYIAMFFLLQGQGTTIFNDLCIVQTVEITFICTTMFIHEVEAQGIIVGLDVDFIMVSKHLKITLSMPIHTFAYYLHSLTEIWFTAQTT